MSIPGIAAIVALLTAQVGGDLKTPQNALAHFRLGELYFEQHNFQGAAGEFREALSGGNPDPRWIEVWAHIDLGEIFDATGQRDRAIREYDFAVRTADNTDGAQSIATQRLKEDEKGSTISLHRVLANVLQGPEPLRKVGAEYSKEALVAQLEGTVLLSAAVGVDGSLSDLKVLKWLGIGLDEAAKSAAQQWAFAPGASRDAAAPMAATIDLDFLLPAKQSHWHLLRVAFGASDEARPHFVSTVYPAGAGVFPEGAEEADFTAAIGRQAIVTLSFAVDETGRPAQLHVEKASQPVWGKEAIAFVRQWRFSAAAKNGQPVSVPCTVDLVWGEKTFTHSSLVRARATFEAEATLAKK